MTDTKEQLINAAVKKYNNILKNKKSSASKSSKKKAKGDDSLKLVALLSRFLAAHTTSDSGSKNASVKSNGFGNARNNNLKAWRFINKGDTIVDSKGKTWFWCPKHNDDKGLYVTHKAEDHQK